MSIQIKNQWTGAVIFSSEESETFSEAVREALGKKIDLSGSDLRGSNLRGSNLRDSNLRGSNLSGSDLSGSDLRGSNLSGSDLRDSNLRGSNLSDSNLRGSNLSGSDLRGSNLRGSNLRGSDLSDSNLRDSNLRDSNLSGSDLSGSNLSGSDLSDSNLRDSNLRSIRNDFWDVLLRTKNEIAGLRLALVEGRVDGSAYEGECACLVGTIANVKHCRYDAIDVLRPDSNRPIERFFLGIKKGDKPAKNQVSKIVVDWIDEFVTLSGAAAK